CPMKTRTGSIVLLMLVLALTALPWPAAAQAAVVLFRFGSLNLSLPLLLRTTLTRLELIAAIVASTWFVLRLIEVAFDHARIALINNHRAGAIAVIPLSRRIVKALAACIAFRCEKDCSRAPSGRRTRRIRTVHGGAA